MTVRGPVPDGRCGVPTPDPRQAGKVTDHPGAWTPPDTGGGAVPAAPAGFVPAVPLGGAPPSAVAEQPESQWRELTLVGLLLLAAVAAGAASLLPWRDYGAVIGPALAETGWRLPGGGLGRGWVAVLLGVVLAVSGVLIAAHRGRAGRTLAVVAGVVCTVFAIAEWGVGAGTGRTGPGPGLWLLFVAGLLAVAAVGVLGAHAGTDPDRESRPPV